MSSSIESLINKDYQPGFVTDIEADTIPPGLSEETVRVISAKKNEPEWLLEWRLKAYRRWLTMTEPHWPNVTYGPIDYQAHQLLLGAEDEEAARQPRRGRSRSCSRRTASSAFRSPSRRCSPASRSTRCSIRCRSARRISEELAKLGIIFCSFGEAVREHPELVGSISAPSFPTRDNFFARSTRRCSPTARSCTCRRACAARWSCRRISASTRRTRVSSSGRSSSPTRARTSATSRGARRPSATTNQLHAAVVELVALEDATIKYSTVQNWYAGDEEGRRRHLQLRDEARQGVRPEVEDLVDAGRDGIGDHVEVSERDPPGRRRRSASSTPWPS